MNPRNIFKPSLKDGKLETREYLKEESEYGCYLGRIHCKAICKVLRGDMTVQESVGWIENRKFRHGLGV